MTVVPQQQPGTQVVTGVIQGIVQKGPDKWQVEVNTGQQNPRRLWTKDQNLVAQLSTMIGQSTSFLCGESHWTNQSGAPVVSLWINGVGPAGGFQNQTQQLPPPVPQQAWPQQAPTTLPIPQQAPTVVQAGDGRITEDVREKRIHRQTASKVAAILLSHLPQEDRTLDNVLRISESLVGYYEYGMQMAQNEAAPPHTDDDIPF